MKKHVFALFHALGVTRFASWYHRKRVIFLCYHGVTKRPTRSPSDPKGLQVNHRRFAAQLGFLQRYYHVISLGDYLTARREARPLPPYSVVLTFDDGFRNFLTVAAPLLAARGLPATIFVITDNTDEQTTADLKLDWIPEDDERYLSWSDIRTLRDMNFEIGSHTCSHSGLLALSPEEIERELLGSYRNVVAHVGAGAPSLAYPKGQHSRLLAAEASKLAYACAVTTDRGANEMDHDLFTLGRTLIGDNDDIASFAVRVSGLRWWLACLREPFLRYLRERPRKIAVCPAPSVLEKVE
jgi:peptidoglycan/xylan/chitin deacetylase (PgdA/CDA1 family)